MGPQGCSADDHVKGLKIVGKLRVVFKQASVRLWQPRIKTGRLSYCSKELVGNYTECYYTYLQATTLTHGDIFCVFSKPLFPVVLMPFHLFQNLSTYPYSVVKFLPIVVFSP